MNKINNRKAISEEYNFVRDTLWPLPLSIDLNLHELFIN